MAGYITFIKYTPQGLAGIKDSPARIKAAKEAASKLGIKCVGFWLTMGEYDLVAIWDAPDDQSVAVFALAVAKLGNATTMTARAFSEDEFAQIAAKLT